MAISGVGSTNSSYRENGDKNGGIYGAAGETDKTEGTEGSDKTQVWDAVFTDKKELGVTAEDFLTLMVAQLTNQDFMNPVDDSQYVTQMAQITTMQQMTELANYSKTSYVMSLVGKNVTAAKITVSGELQKETGPVQSVSLNNNEFTIVVNKKKFTLEQIMEIHSGSASDSTDGTDSATQVDSKKNYLLSLLGREVTIDKKGDDSDDTLSYQVTGVVEKTSTKDGEYRVYVKGEWHSLDEVTEVAGENKTDTEADGSEKGEEENDG